MCVLHQSEADFEVLMVRRGSTAKFMAGAWVFPGGVVDPEDHDDAAVATIEGLSKPDLGPWLAAAFREVVEETGVWLTSPPSVAALGDGDVFATVRSQGLYFAGDRTAYFANWITPTMIPVRFDARFFVAAIEEKVTPIPDEREVDAAEFVSPVEALRRADSGEWLVPFPTQRTLHQLAGFRSLGAMFEEWRRSEVVAVQPRMRVAADGSLEVVMPDEPGFDDLQDEVPDPEVLVKAARAAADKGRPIAEMANDGD
ncbi:MAG: NUDIX domain-containing protein [Actinomycetota bacterium]|nr:NUDIX domain-containing protein [Actinomycetota bacterium]